MEHLRKTPAGGTEYEFRGQWLEAEVRREEIKVKGSSPVTEEVVITRHGPIINALIEGEEVEAPLALRWTALERSNMTKTLIEMNRAASCEELREALRGWNVPTQNTIYADRQGNIGYSYPGKIPIRAKGNGAVPVPGWTGEYEWTGYIAYEELPHLSNPAPGYIASANNRVVDDGYSYWVSPDFCASGRARRIVERIEEKGILSVQDIADMHMDQISILARETMRCLQGFEADDAELALVFRLFEDWDGLLSATSPQAAIYEVFTLYLIVRITEAKLGRLAARYAGKGPTPVLAEVSMFAEHSREWLLATLCDPASPWWETGAGGGRKGMICGVMRETMDTLKKICGPDIEDWAWGKMHRLTFGHPLGSVKPLDRIFRRGPYPIGGDGDTIWASGANRIDLGEREMVGPPFRFIADLSDWNRCLGILVPGQSGHPASPHYDDNIAGYFRGEYHPMLFDREQVEEAVSSRLALEP